MYTHEKKVLTQGKPLEQSGKAIILIHGRGATAASILPLAHELGADDFTLYAPQATNNTWYPYSFMVPVAQNQPALDSALALIDETVKSIEAQGIASKDIYLLGFSQGACLTAEYATRNARRYGGLLILTGGLIGQQLDTGHYSGDFEGTPVLITTGDPDPHVPVSRVDETVQQMEGRGATVTRQVYPGRPHTILEEELALARKVLTS
ncbi:dienelactone hydrolase family protein [Pontibacter sp. JH31]|uniref:Dienelactone hydrolase family protein n=1 Tax=Pontibacter aquaedesilientis TaxID=2766980 RepID=A0ABR7XEB8_9BACT|nr:dienelactone hydrolase family protein [Pontibacter aquaedesilientis]MBD1396634.1 dienelactone hydrolase family protein [Pontibacter aquaedesilientis]